MDKRAFFERMQTIDRRWIFILIACAVVIPMAFDLRLAEPATPEVQTIFDKIEELPEGSPVLVSFDFDPPSRPELQPMAISYIRHLAHRRHKIYITALWPFGQAEARLILEEYLEKEFPTLKYGIDYVLLGYRPGAQAVIQSIVADIRAMYTYDHEGNPVDSMAMMEDVHRLADFDLILNVSAGYPGLKEWIQFGGDQSGVPIAGGVTAVSAPLLYPYYPKQMFGIMGGLKAAAEYETLLMEAYPETYTDMNGFDAIGRMGSQTFAHLIIILFIIVGNIAYFATGGGKGRSRLKALEK